MERTGNYCLLAGMQGSFVSHWPFEEGEKRYSANMDKQWYIWVEKDNINPKQRNFYNFKRLNFEEKNKPESASMLEVAAFVVLIYLLLFKNNSCYLPPISKKQLVQLLLIFIFFNSYFY